MKLFIIQTLEKLQAWTLKWVETPYAATTLFLIAMIEAVFFPIPPEIPMIAMIATKPKKWKKWVIITITGSIVGGVLGYTIGNGFYGVVGHKFIQYYNVQDAMNIVKTQFANNALLAILVAAITPIVPYKAMVLAAGLFKIPISQIIIGSLVGRGLRYFSIGWLVKKYGEKMSEIIYERINEISIIIVIILVLILIAVKTIF